MKAEKLAEIIKKGRTLTPDDFNFVEINKNCYAKHPFELKLIHNGWNLIKWVNDDGLVPKILLKNINLDTPGLMKLQKHLRNEKLDELLGLIS